MRFEEFVGLIAKNIATMMLLCIVMLVTIPVGSLLGALGGFFVGSIFGGQISEVFSAVGLNQLAAVSFWKIGATLGFLGSFFSIVAVEKGQATS